MLFSNEEINQYLITYDNTHLFDFSNLSHTIICEAIQYGESYLNFDWGTLSAGLYMEFVKNGNRTHYENVNFLRRQALACLTAAETAEKQGRFLNDIINGVWAICEETTWVLPAHNGGNKLADITEPSIDLFSAQTAALLALCVHLLKQELNEISETVVSRVEYEITRRVIHPFLEHEFWWMGFGENRREIPSNWTAWCNSTCMTACLLIEKNQEKRCSFIRKSCEILSYYIEHYPDDGGCDEGANYWYVSAGCMFDCLEQLYRATDYKINGFSIPKVKRMGAYIYKMYIGDRYFVNFADCSAVAEKGGARTYLFGKRVRDQKLQSFGADDYKNLTYKLLPDSMNMLHKCFAIEYADEILSYAGIYCPDDEACYMESLQLYKESRGGVTLAVKGGRNDDNHNHNDVGSFLVYADHQPVIIDVGVGSYSKKTFSKDRYTIWTMQSSYHNLPQINGVMQQDGGQYRAEAVSVLEHGLAYNLERAYPETSGLVSWRRSVVLEEAAVMITDTAVCHHETDDINLNLMTKEQPVIRGKMVQVGQMLIECDTDLHIEIEKIEIPADAKLTPVWGECVYRIVYSLKHKCSTYRNIMKIRRR